MTVNNAKTCSWSSSPKVPGFATTVRCKSGRIERSVKFGANPLTKAEDYAVKPTVRGKTTTVDHLKVVEAPADHNDDHDHYDRSPNDDDSPVHNCDDQHDDVDNHDDHTQHDNVVHHDNHDDNAALWAIPRP